MIWLRHSHPSNITVGRKSVLAYIVIVLIFCTVRRWTYLNTHSWCSVTTLTRDTCSFVNDYYYTNEANYYTNEAITRTCKFNSHIQTRLQKLPGFPHIQNIHWRVFFRFRLIKDGDFRRNMERNVHWSATLNQSII